MKDKNERRNTSENVLFFYMFTLVKQSGSCVYGKLTLIWTGMCRDLLHSMAPPTTLSTNRRRTEERGGVRLNKLRAAWLSTFCGWSLDRSLHIGRVLIGHRFTSRRPASSFWFILVPLGWSCSFTSCGWCHNSLLIGHAIDQLPVSFLVECFQLKMSISDHYSPAVKAQAGGFVVPVDKRTTVKQNPPTTKRRGRRAALLTWKQN